MNRALPVVAILALIAATLAWVLIGASHTNGARLDGSGAATSDGRDGDEEKPALPSLAGEAEKEGDPEHPGGPGAAGGSSEHTPSPESEVVELYLAGRVVDERGQAVRGVELHGEAEDQDDVGSPQVVHDLGTIRSDAQGRFSFERRYGAPPEVARRISQQLRDDVPYKVKLVVDRFHLLKEPRRRYEGGSRHVDVVVLARPSVRVQILDAQTRRPMPVGTWACPGFGVVDDGGWARLFGSEGATLLTFTAEGYATATATIAFPRSGEVTRAEPILLERGFAIRGRTTDPDRKILAKAFVVAERTGGPASTFAQFTHARGDGEGRWELSLPVGTYRVMVFANGHAPWSAAVAVQDRDQDLTATLRKFGTEGPPAALPFRWADRKTLRIPMEIEDLPAPEIVAWIETIVGARITLQGRALDALKEVRLNASFRGLPVTSALELIAMLGELEFDEVKAILR